jgi:Fe-S cluster assembly ATP-binding protein
MLEIRNLHAKAGEKLILRGVNLKVGAGEVHAIMGPNGSGKSTLAQVIAGRDLYEVTEGEILYEGRNLLELSPEERAREGIFLAFQYPVEIPGVSNLYFLRTALNAIRKHRGLEELDVMDFMELVRERVKLLGSTRRCWSARSTRASPEGKRNATRSCKWRCWSRGWPFWTKPTPASTLTRSRR